MEANRILSVDDFGPLDDLAIDIGKYMRRTRSGDKEDPEDRRIRAPLALPMQDLLDYVHFREDEQSVPASELRPAKLSWVFRMLAQMSKGLESMHVVLGQVHGDVSPANMMWHRKSNGRTVYRLNDFDSGYTGRMNP